MGSITAPSASTYIGAFSLLALMHKIWAGKAVNIFAARILRRF
jgi:hypothetical protein